jgi:hypothetical protein
MPKSSPHQITLSCPSCQGRLYRVPRNFLDLIISKFVPRRRYRCFSVACCWEGPIRHRQSSTAATPNTPEENRRYIL